MLVENMRITANGRYRVSTPEVGNSFITRNIISGNAFGISCRLACLIEANVISANNEVAVSMVGPGGSLLGNTIAFNGAYGLDTHIATGLGNNTVVGNGSGSATGTLLPLHPNACYPQPC